MSVHSRHWTFASDRVRAELGENPERLLKTGEEVKSNPVRKVIRSGDWFLKCDRRGAARFRSEWKSAKLLEDYGIPVVEYLACGDLPEGGILISRAQPDSEPVSTYYWKNFVRDGEDPESFLKLFAPFLRQMFTCGLFHPDFHIGNILYEKGNKRFVLVDARGIRQAGLFDRWFRAYRMQRIVMELREVLGRERMIQLITESGIPNPEPFYKCALDREADALWKEWPKRRRQILAGYPKFTRKIDGILYAVNPLREIEETVDCAVLKGPPGELERMFLAHFFLQMALIPHRRAMAFNPEEGLLYLEQRPAIAVPARSHEQRERLAAFDFQSELTDWLRFNDGGPVRFFNLSGIARRM